MTEMPVGIILGRLNAKNGCVRMSGAGWSARCPAHDDKNPSLSISIGEGGRVLVKCHGGCELAAIMGALGLSTADLFPGDYTPVESGMAEQYDYRDEAGQLLFQVVRRRPKGFFCRRPNGKGDWLNNMADVRRVLYQLPELKATLGATPPGRRVAFVVEGEKDVDRLRGLGLAAICNPGGAGKWTAEFTKQLQDAGAETVAILPDYDEPGDKHARQVALACDGAGLTARVVQLPWDPPLESRRGQDVSDWLDRGNKPERLLRLVEESPRFVPDTAPSTDPRRPGLALTPIGTLLAEPVEEADWLVDDMLPVGGLSVLAGKPKAGKSTEGRILARCVARGEPWLGRATKRGTVFYLALEEKRSQVRQHFERMETRADDPILLFISALPEDGLAQIRAAAEERKPALIIVDTLIRATRLKDINDYAAVSNALEPYLMLARETKAHVFFVHHMGKGERVNPDAILGSTAIYAAVDTALLLIRTDRYRTIQSFQRYGEDFPETVLQLDAATGFTALGGTREEADQAHLGESLVAELHGKSGPLPEDDILSVVEGRKKVKERALRRLVAGGRISRTGRGVKGDPYLYCVSGFLPPSKEREGESPNSHEAVSPSADSGNSPSQETLQRDSPSQDHARGDAASETDARSRQPLYGAWEPVDAEADHDV